ncbi:MAG: hypothetical protein HY800_03085 [Ignavibacteriales bacterium]|nr:hypothetical protein [Ignavibacteriales bacterium]
MNEILLPVNTKPYDVIKIIAHTKYGSESQPIYRFIKKPLGPARDVHIQTDVLHDYVLFTITTTGVFTESPEIVVDENNITMTLTASAIDINKYQAVYVPSDDYHSNRIVKVNAEVNGKQVLASSDFLLFPISPNKANSFSFDNGSINISYDSGAVFKPLYMQIEKGKYNRFTTYNIEPQDILLNRGFRISVRSDEIDNYTGLYYRSTHGWIFQTSEIDRESNSFSTLLTHSLGEIGLLKDDTPPTFGRFRLRHYNRNLNISFRYHDNLSGVDTDEIKMYLDDELIIPEIDGEHRKVWYNSQESLEKGKHTVRITMKDKMKNESQLVRTFNVK